MQNTKHNSDFPRFLRLVCLAQLSTKICGFAIIDFSCVNWVVFYFVKTTFSRIFMPQVVLPSPYLLQRKVSARSRKMSLAAVLPGSNHCIATSLHQSLLNDFAVGAHVECCTIQSMATTPATSRKNKKGKIVNRPLPTHAKKVKIDLRRLQVGKSEKKKNKTPTADKTRTVASRVQRDLQPPQVEKIEEKMEEK